MNSKFNGSSSRIPEREKALILYNLYKPQYNASLRKLALKIKKLLNHANLNAELKHRLKTFDSYFNKALRIQTTKKNCYKINDILGIRIICPFIEDIDNVENMISDNFDVVEIERKGSQNSLAEFGYNSIHILISLPNNSLHDSIPFTGKVCEIQIRTILQEAWAEIEHELIYKANFSLLNNSLKKKLASLNATLSLSDIIFQEIRDYQKEIQILDERRRDSLHNKVTIEDHLLLIEPLNRSCSADEGKSDVKPKSSMDKLLFEALDAHSQNHFDRAIEIYSAILTKKLNDEVKSIIYNHRGMAYFVLSNYKNSLRDFTSALKYNPNNFRAKNNRGMAYKIQHKYDKALDDFNQSIQINPFQLEGYYNRALIYIDIDDYMMALEDCLKVLNIKPDFVPAQRLKSIIQSKIFQK